MDTSKQNNSLVNGSTARTWVESVVRTRWFPKGTVTEKAKGPAGMGQKEETLLVKVGSGDGGRSVEHRYDVLDHAVKVKTDVVVNSVDRLLLALENPIMPWELSPISVKFIYLPSASLGRTWA